MRQVLRPGALGRPRGIGWRGRGKGGLGWGIHVNPWLIHVNVWQKPLQYCKVISLQLIKINRKKKVVVFCYLFSITCIPLSHNCFSAILLKVELFREHKSLWFCCLRVVWEFNFCKDSIAYELNYFLRPSWIFPNASLEFWNMST